MEREMQEHFRTVATFGSTLRYTFGKNDIVARGILGTIYKATVVSRGNMKEETEIVAVKRIILNKKKVNKSTLKRLELLPLLKHENVVSYHKICVGMPQLSNGIPVDFVMDYCEEMDLATIMREFRECDGKLNLRTILDYSKQLANGLAYLHRNNVVHGVLTSSSVLVERPTGNCNRVKIAGLDRITVLSGSNNGSDELPSYGTFEFFMSPEMLSNVICGAAETVDHKTDIWTLGCVILQLANFCFKTDVRELDKYGTLKLLTEGYAPHVSESIPKEFTDILYGCFRKSSKERLTAEQLVNKLVAIEEQTYGSISRYCSSANKSIFDDTFRDEDLRRQMNETFGYSCSYAYSYPCDYIGQGAFGTVYKAYIVEFGDYTGSGVVAVKEVVLDAVNMRRLRKDHLWEPAKERWRLLLNIKHPNLVTYHQIMIRKLVRGVGVDFMMEYCAGGDLSSFLEQQRSQRTRLANTMIHMTMELAGDYALQITNGLVAIHENGFIHGDLKPSNIFMKVGANQRCTLLVGDLDGMVKGQKNSISFLERRGVRGTVPYMSPEMVALTFQEEHADEDIGFHVDVWSLGCVILDLVDCCFGIEERWFCKRVIDGNKQIKLEKIRRKDFPADTFLFKLKDGYRPFVDPLVPNDIAKILRSCLEPAWNKRSTAEKVLKKLRLYERRRNAATKLNVCLSV